MRNNYSGSRNTVTLEAGHGMPCPYNLNTGHVSIIRRDSVEPIRRRFLSHHELLQTAIE